jgi:hypothetical protein
MSALSPLLHPDSRTRRGDTTSPKNPFRAAKPDPAPLSRIQMLKEKFRFFSGRDPKGRCSGRRKLATVGYRYDRARPGTRRLRVGWSRAHAPALQRSAWAASKRGHPTLRAVLDRRPITLEGSGSARLLRTTTPGKDSIRKDSAYLGSTSCCYRSATSGSGSLRRGRPYTHRRLNCLMFFW